MKNNTLPLLNRMLAILILMAALIVSIASIAAGFYAVFGESFFYSSLIIKLFPYSDTPFLDSFFDFFRVIMRIFAGILPALIITAITNIFIHYLTYGKKSALTELKILCGAFFYQLMHPFSNPRAPMNSNEKESKHEQRND